MHLMVKSHYCKIRIFKGFHCFAFFLIENTSEFRGNSQELQEWDENALWTKYDSSSHLIKNRKHYKRCQKKKNKKTKTQKNQNKNK